VTEGRRRYDSPVRRRQLADSRDRIVAAGEELLHGFPVWSWSALTVRAVAKRAGLSERTVYRHFRNERELRQAVFARSREEARVDPDTLTFENLRDTTERVLSYLSSFPAETRTKRDATQLEAARHQRDAMLAAVSSATSHWSEADRALAAGVLDVLWAATSYERLVIDWELEPQEAIRGLLWVLDLVPQAIRAERRPGG